MAELLAMEAEKEKKEAAGVNDDVPPPPPTSPPPAREEKGTTGDNDGDDENDDDEEEDADGDDEEEEDELAGDVWSAQTEWPGVRRTLFCTTFNAGGSNPSKHPEGLGAWIPQPFSTRTTLDMARGAMRTTTSEGHAMYIIGMQECGVASSLHEQWRVAIAKHLGPRYAMVTEVHLWEMCLFCFALKTEVPSITGVATDTVATGMGIAKEITGVQIGNKGGLGIGLQWRDTSIAFVCTHLAARAERLEQRRKDYMQIVTREFLGCPHAKGSSSYGFVISPSSPLVSPLVSSLAPPPPQHFALHRHAPRVWQHRRADADEQERTADASAHALV